MRFGLLASILVSLVCANSALAEAPAPPAVTTPAAAVSDTPPSSPTVASVTVTKGNNCAAKYYPAEAIRLGHQGSTIVTVHIDETGNVTKTDVSQSSGFKELDQAAVDCVTSAWHFSPATQDGKPVASTKQYRIVWRLNNGNVRPGLNMDTSHLCEPVYASAKARWPSYRAVTLQFRVTTTGAVVQPFVAIPSGDELFDAKAVQCLSKLSYTAAQIQGTPTEVSWTAAVLWSPRTGLAFADGRDMGFYCPDSIFPANLWKGDPSGPTEISYATILNLFGGNFAIERESGNPELDQAALTCVKNAVPQLPAGKSTDSSLPEGQKIPMPIGHLVRFNWREGHAFILNMRGN